PGDYLVYAETGGEPNIRAAAFTTLHVEPEEVYDDPISLDVDLSAARTLKGAVYYTNTSGEPVKVVDDNITVEVPPAASSFQVAVDGRGEYSVLLPQGDYVLSGSISADEYNMTMTYEGSANVTIPEGTGESTADLKLALVKEYGLKMEAEPSGIDTTPGSVFHVNLTITNTGNVADDITLSYTPADWNVTIPEEEHLDFLGEKTVRARVEVPEDVRTDHPPLTFSATSKGDRDAKASVTVEVTVPHELDFNVSLYWKTPVFDGATYNTGLVVENLGNGPDKYTLEITNSEELLEEGWGVTFKETGSALAENRSIDSGNHTFEIVAKANRIGAPLGLDIYVSVVSVSSPERQEKVIAVPLREASLQVVNATASGGMTYPDPDLQTPFLVFVSLSLILLAILIMYGAPRKRRRWRR
ncbi:MAG: hypothetical protein J7L61_03205, partial [Thermoplasmata archaeon]|nr:hypothetical protein [Thermoplasmata archaeon]